MRILFVSLLLSTCVLTLSFAQEKEVKPLGLTLENYQYPYKVSYLTVHDQKQRLKMAYMDVKPGNANGQTVLLFHGKNFNGAYWATTIEALTLEGFRVIAPDQIGFGKSAKPLNFQYSFHQLALNTKTLLDSLGVNQVAVLGHSMGGMLATRFAVMFPENTTKLILENPIGLEDYKVKIPYKTVDWWYQNELGKDYASIKKYMMENYYDGHWKPAYEEWVNILAGWTESEDYPTIAWNSALTYDMILTQPVVYEFDRIKAPTLLIIGTRDRTAVGKPLVDKKTRSTMGQYDKLGSITCEKIENCTLKEIPGIGHLPHIESFPEFIKPLVNFLNQ